MIFYNKSVQMLLMETTRLGSGKKLILTFACWLLILLILNCSSLKHLSRRNLINKPLFFLGKNGYSKIGEIWPVYSMSILILILSIPGIDFVLLCNEDLLQSAKNLNKSSSLSLSPSWNEQVIEYDLLKTKLHLYLYLTTYKNILYDLNLLTMSVSLFLVSIYFTVLRNKFIF